jgi:hypothetical protein
VKAILATAVLLAACGADEEKMTSGMILQPGEWNISVEDVAQNIPYGEGSIQYELTNQVSGPRGGFQGCLSPTDAVRPPAEFLTGNFHARGCAYQEFSATGGRLRAVAVCANEGMRFDFAGDFAATSFEISTTSAHRATAQSKIAFPLDTETRTIGRRVGACRD